MRSAGQFFGGFKCQESERFGVFQILFDLACPKGLQMNFHFFTSLFMRYTTAIWISAQITILVGLTFIFYFFVNIINCLQICIFVVKIKQYQCFISTFVYYYYHVHIISL